jgi:hypothetical protein
MTKLLRIEGVNLSNSIDDTEDLSTRRGGSLMLLNAIKDIQTELKSDLKPISTGASAGLFKIISDKNSDEIKSKIKIILENKEKPYRFGTFVLSEEEMNGEFQPAERSAIAQNRWQQMQSLSFSSEGLRPANEVCNRDEVRPASEPDYAYDGKKIKLSQSVKVRRFYGRNAKSAFYAKFLDKDMKAKFADDFETISKGLNDLALPEDEKIKPDTLDGKIAVFYADGNSFGKIANGCMDDGQLHEWDKHIRGKRENLLKELLKKINGNARWLNKEVLRFETLLWGGDELMFVVPGWCGMELAKFFIEQTKNWEFKHKEKDGKDITTKLTHACGLVFCHHQAPISRISALAKDLAEQGKIANRIAKLDVNSLNWIVLESFDQAGGDLDEYLKEKFKGPMPWKNLALSPDAVSAMSEKMPELKVKLPRSAIVKIVRALAEGKTTSLEPKASSSEPKENEKLKPADLIERAYCQVHEVATEDFKILWKLIHPDPQKAEWQDWSFTNSENKPKVDLSDLAAWIKLIELWDYCVPTLKGEYLGEPA